MSRKTSNYTKEQLEAMTTEELMFLLSPDFNVGRTYFGSGSKAFIVEHNYALIGNVNDGIDDIDKWQTFGYPKGKIADALQPAVYGSTPKKALLNFYRLYPNLIITKNR
jgi:hypothetical protein